MKQPRTVIHTAPRIQLVEEMEAEFEAKRELFAQCREFDKPFVHGMFDLVVDSMLDVEVSKVTRRLKDFTNTVVPHAIQKGDTVARHPLVASLGETKWVYCWMEAHEMVSKLQEHGYRLACVKIRASSSILGIFCLCNPPLESYCPAFPTDGIGIATLIPAICSKRIHDVQEEVNRINPSTFAVHYSTYNKDKQWTALSLRGYWKDPTMIAKPSEMNKKWKSENPGWESLTPTVDTPLAEQCPEIMHIVRQLEAENVRAHRVRIMRLAKGGHIGRHADITDEDAGTQDGQLMRIHVPIVTNPNVVFRTWNFDGTMTETHMQEGSLWYLDVRKPHEVKNEGDCDRIHLVVDVPAHDGLRKHLAL